MCIDKAAFHAAARNHKLALCCSCLAGDRHRLDRLACEALGKDATPGNIETAIGRTHRRNPDALPLEYSTPCAIGTQLGPACASEGKQCGIARNKFNSIWRLHERPTRIEAYPFLPGQDFNALCFQSTYPRAQQRRSFHGFGKYAAGGADKTFCAERIGPVA